MTQTVFLSAGEAAVLASVIKERLAIAAIHIFDFADKYGVVTGGMFGDDFTGEVGERIVKKRNSRRGPVEANAQALFHFRSLFALREMVGERFLAFAKDADAKAALRFQEREKPRILIDTNENQQRIKRDGSEGVGGHAVHAAGFSLDGDDGDAGDKRAGDTAEHRWVERGDGHGASR